MAALVVSAGWAVRADASATCTQTQICVFDPCAWPASPVPAQFWGELQPADTTIPLDVSTATAITTARDITPFDEFAGLYSSNPYYYGIDIQNNWVFTAMSYGVKVWNLAGSTNGLPTFVSYLPFTAFPSWPSGNEDKVVIQDISLPSGVDTIGAVTGVAGVGLAIVDFTNKSMPTVRYQHYGSDATSVYSATLGGVHYAFSASPTGLRVYNMDAAVSHNLVGCKESSPGTNCPGVYVGQIGTSFASYVAGVDNYLVVSTGSGAGFDLWDVSNPAAPVHKLSSLTSVSVFGVAMWKDTGGNYYVGARTGPGFNTPSAPHQLSILNATCVASGCTSLPAVSATPDNSAVAAGVTQSYYLTFSRESDGTPFLYLGSDENCGNPIAQREYLLDVINPAAPRDITPPQTSLFAGAGGQNYQVGYWGWYYQKNPTGFNLVMPRKGKFAGQYFYRVAQTLFDVHKRVGATAPTAAFNWSPQQVYPGTPVTFTDQSSGTPTSWSWSFQPDGSPASATVENPAGVTFATPGPKTVALTAQNAQGSNGTSQTLTVLNPQPQIGSLAVSPVSPLQCQPITLTASGVTGAPPLTYAWNITNSNSVTAPGGSSSATTFLWDTGANSVPAGSYTATLTVSGTGGPAVMSTPVTLAALQALPISFTPTNDAFASATIQFHAGVAGATSWNWNYGDGAGFTGWTSDPINGPNPVHTYSAVNDYSVQVMVRNCLSPTTVTSGALTVDVTQVTPLVANFGPVCAFAPCAFGAGTAISFVDHSTGATFWDYDWNGTGTFSDAGHTVPITSHTYTVAGNYSPILRVRRGTEEQATFTVTPPINVSPAGPPPPPPPTATITVSGPSSGAPSTAYTFTGLASNCTPAATWSWIVGTGGTVSGSSTSSSITVSWATTGNFSLAVTNSGCSGAFGSKTISISSGGPGGNPGSLTSSFVFSPASPNAGQNVSFDGTSSKGSPTSYNWFFGDNTNGTGATVSHVYAAQGTYTVKLDTVAPGAGVNCFNGSCTVESSQVIVVNTPTGAPPPAPLSSDFSSSAGACSNVGGFAFCPAVAGTAATLTAVETRGTGFAWNFGDGTTGSGATVTHTWNKAESYSVSLTVSAAGFASTTTVKTFQVTAPPAPTFQSLVLPWIAETRGALVQSCDLYLHNPGTDPLDVTLQFLKRGTPQNPPPQATATIDPGATMFVSDVLQNLFQQDNIAGFVTVTVKTTDPLPIITSFNTVVAASGTQFGQTVPGLPLSNANPPATTASGPSEFTLIGLNDNASELAYFGLTNPTASTATYNIQLFDNTGAQIGGSSTALTLGPFGQRQFQESDITNLFGLSSGTDYRVEVQDSAGGTLIPYGENVRLGSGAPTFITSGTTSAAKQYVIGAYSTAGAWQSDVVLANTSTQPMDLSLTFSRLGVTAPTTAPVALTLNPGQTQRLSNAIATEWNLNNTVGVITVSSNAASGPYPIVQAESYNNAQPANRFGQSMMAFSDAEAAGVGQSDYLVGLRQDGKNFVTTFWVFNPSPTDFGVYDVVYLGLDGSVLGTVSDVSLPPGKVRQFLPAQHLIPAAGVVNGFTVQVKVKEGKALAAAQVLTTATGAPAYVAATAE